MTNIRYNLTGKQLTRSVSKMALRRVIQFSMLTVFFALFFGMLTVMIFSNISEYWFFLLTTPAWFLCFYYSIKAVRQHYEEYCLGDQNDLFYLYGAPDEIAEVLSDPQNIQLLNSRQVVFTQSYIMTHNDFLTYVPLSDIAQLTVSRTHGKHPRAYIMILKKSGGTRRYQFESPTLLHSVSKQVQEITGILAEYLPRYAPDCRLN